LVADAFSKSLQIGLIESLYFVHFI
jgi:hypothetical protein